MESNQASLAVIGINIGKEVFHIVGLGVDGKIAFRREIRRSGLKDAFEKPPPCIVGMEACLSAHFVSRLLRALGHKPRIIPAIYVKPFVTAGPYMWGNSARSHGTTERPLWGMGRPSASTRERPLKGRERPAGCAKILTSEQHAISSLVVE